MRACSAPQALLSKGKATSLKTNQRATPGFPRVVFIAVHAVVVLGAGRRRRLSGAYWAERQPYMTINADKKTDQVFRYEMKVPYESWMAGATLVLRMVQTSPGGVRRVFTVDVNGAVDVSRK